MRRFLISLLALCAFVVMARTACAAPALKRPAQYPKASACGIADCDCGCARTGACDCRLAGHRPASKRPLQCPYPMPVGQNWRWDDCAGWWKWAEVPAAVPLPVMPMMLPPVMGLPAPGGCIGGS